MHDKSKTQNNNNFSYLDRIELRAATIDLAEEWHAAILERQEQLVSRYTVSITPLVAELRLVAGMDARGRGRRPLGEQRRRR